MENLMELTKNSFGVEYTGHFKVCPQIATYVSIMS